VEGFALKRDARRSCNLLLVAGAYRLDHRGLTLACFIQ